MCVCACEIGIYLKLYMECILWGKGLHCQILGFYRCLNSHISCSLKSFYASIQKAKVSSNVSQTKRPSVFSESASVNASLSVAVSGPSYSSKSDPASHSITATLSQGVSINSSALQSQSSARSSSTRFSAISASASETGSSSASQLKSTSSLVSQNISASKSESFSF